ncbi:uncharacterized protein FTJAE_7217 [Fusarium tjaetaba]|uniref:Uncharacterized protein n=1 Tax=Fusarium tjaetaba TaxID=1567544 RepID=A0A8H5VSZ3_9HYPO|nr:uncharacterized protein FTJAE_7217 [Fusarium tjaetaba]KAF5633320.1 hypothetical protein FTJAE_7217 [Fusarium tjaetaba]
MSIAAAVSTALEYQWVCVLWPNAEIDPSRAAARRVTQAYWNALDSEFSTDRPLTRLEKWRVMQCVLEAASALRFLVVALSNPCRTTSRNPNGVAPTGPEIHDDTTIEGDIRRTVPAYTRECREANAFVAALERLPTAFETPVDGENDRKKAKLPPMELHDEFIEDMERLVAEGKETVCNAVRTIGQGPVRRGAAQATPQKRRRALKEDDDDLQKSSIRDSES